MDCVEDLAILMSQMALVWVGGGIYRQVQLAEGGSGEWSETTLCSSGS